MPQPDHDPSIEHEPHLRRSDHEVDPSEHAASRILAAESSGTNIDDAIDRSVWGEPAVSPELTADVQATDMTYAQWLAWRIKTTSVGRTWAVTLILVLTAGPWAILGALFRGIATGAWGLLAVAVIGPATEEIMKVAVALWVVEKRPYLFSRPLQIVLCCLAGGLAFAAIENVVYLFIYFPDASAMLVTTRWTICLALHITCSLIAGIGLVQVWSRTMSQRSRPRIGLAVPWIVSAIVIHGIYNGLVSLAELSGWLRF